MTERVNYADGYDDIDPWDIESGSIIVDDKLVGNDVQYRNIIPPSSDKVKLLFDDDGCANFMRGPSTDSQIESVDISKVFGIRFYPGNNGFQKIDLHLNNGQVTTLFKATK